MEKKKEAIYTVKSVEGAAAAVAEVLAQHKKYKSVNVDSSGGLKSKQRIWGGCERWPQEP